MDTTNNTSSVVFTPEENERIEQCCCQMRRTKKARNNMFYIVQAFCRISTCSVFQISMNDAISYTNLLSKWYSSGDIKKSYGDSIYYELLTFYDCAASLGYIEQNPFRKIPNPFPETKGFDVTRLPSLTDVDSLITICSDDRMLTCAILLALRMALPISEIVELKKNQLCYDKSRDAYYMKARRRLANEKQECFLSVPEDVVKILMEVASLSAEVYPYFLANQHRRPYAIRTLQYALDRATKNSDLHICFSDLRNLSMYLMLIEKVPVADILSYTGIKKGVTARWLQSYESLPEELVLDAASYVHLRVIT